MSQSSDLEVFVACLRGSDDGRWERFFERFGDRVRSGVARALMRMDQRVRRDEIDDLVQEVYCRLLERCGDGRVDFRGTSIGEAVRYLQRVCESVVVDTLRSRCAQKRGGSFEPVELESGGESGADLIVDPAPTPESLAIRRELRECVLASCRACFRRAQLERDVTIFEKAVLDGWTSREIAEGLDCGLKAGSIDSLVHRQRKKLRECGITLPRRGPVTMARRTATPLVASRGGDTL